MFPLPILDTPWGILYNLGIKERKQVADLECKNLIFISHDNADSAQALALYNLLLEAEPEWKDRIFFVHQRDVAGGAENFHETFHDNGPTDMPAMLRVYKEVGYDGPLRSDHVPTMAGEDNSQPSYGISGTLFGVGYLKGMMDAIGIEY